MSEEKMGAKGRGWMAKVKDQCVYAQCRSRATMTYGYGFSYCYDHVHHGAKAGFKGNPDQITKK